MSQIADFLRARYAERRTLAEAAAKGAWCAEPYAYGSPEEGWSNPAHWEIKAGNVDVVAHQPHEGGGIYEQADARHIEANQPVDVIADLDAKLALVDELDAADPHGGYITGTFTAYDALKLLARPFAGHPDHKGEEWAP
ncbi:DUF6221 family protein [Streptomyces sp. NPDC054871]